MKIKAVWVIESTHGQPSKHMYIKERGNDWWVDHTTGQLGSYKLTYQVIRMLGNAFNRYKRLP